MAKKKKTQKAGIKKRQTLKTQKRTQKKRALAAQAPRQKNMKPGQVKKLLRNLPQLVYEPEMQACRFTLAEVTAAEEAHEKTPDAIDALATEAYLEKYGTALQNMNSRLQAEGKKNLLILVQAMLYFFEQKAPACMNQVIVGLFHLAKLGEMDLDPLQKTLQAYDEQWQEYLEEKAQEQMAQGEMADLAATLPEKTEAEPDEAPAVSPFADLLKDFGPWLQTTAQLEPDPAERCLEDAEALLLDYAEEKELTQITDLTAKKVRLFLEGWFPRNMNPTEEDITLMKSSLNRLFEFLLATGQTPVEEVGKVAAFTQN